jgi:hypothetical protein
MVKAQAMAVVSGMLLAAAPLHAAQDIESPHAVITALTGDGATRGPDGPAFPGTWVPFGEQAEAHIVFPDDSVNTPSAGSAVMMLVGYDTIVHIGTDATPAAVTLLDRQIGQNTDADEAGPELPLGLNVTAGRILVVRRAQDLQWFLTAAGDDAYLVSRGCSFEMDVKGSNVSVSVASGEAYFYIDKLPQEIVDQAGNLIKEGMPVQPGKSMSADTAAAGDLSSFAGAANRLSGDLYAFGLSKGSEWIAVAEEGDFTPTRGEGQGAGGFFVGELGVPQLTFDQARATVVTTPRVAISRTGLSNVVVAGGGLPLSLQLATRTNPASAVVGQRLLRTRIVGIPGSFGGVRANPQTGVTIRLPSLP